MDLVKQREVLIIKFLSMMCLMILLLGPITAVAAEVERSDVVNVMCQAINQLTGPIGKSITVIIVISLGIMLLLGKVTWGVAIALAVGMGVIFGAKDLVNILSGQNEVLCPV